MTRPDGHPDSHPDARPAGPAVASAPTASARDWTTRAERPEDAPVLRALLRAAFDGTEEADLVEALREDRGAWIDGFSQVAVDGPAGSERVIAQALLTRAHVDGQAVLALAPCATLPAQQRRGAGSAAIRAVLAVARERLVGAGAGAGAGAGEGGATENLVVVLGHPEYYPRFGFRPASRLGVTAPFDVPDEAFMALALDPDLPTPRGEIVYPAAFGI